MNARMRGIKPDFFLDEEVAGLPPLVRLLFIGLWTACDREGRTEDRPARLKAQILPYDDLDVDEALTLLAQRRFIVRYERGGRRLIQVRTFSQHQHPHPKEPRSILPMPSVHEPCMTDASTMHESSMAMQCPTWETFSGSCRADSDSGSSDTDTDTDTNTEIQIPPARAIPVAPPTTVARPAAEPRRSARPTENLHSRLLEDFARQWSAMYGHPYSPTPAEKSQLGRLLQSLPPADADDLPRRFANYLADSSRFVAEEMRHSLKHFCTSGGANKYAVRVKVATTVAEKNALFVAKIEARARGEAP